MEELLAFCENHFVENFIQPYAGAKRECFFCGKMEGKRHSDDCATTRFIELRNKLNIGEKLTPREIRNIYKQANGIDVLSISITPPYIEWLEKQLADSNFNTIETLEKIIEFKEPCHICETPQYSTKHGVCKNSECFLYIFKDNVKANKSSK